MAFQRLRSDSSPSLVTNECSCRDGPCAFIPTVASVRAPQRRSRLASAVQHFGPRMAASELARREEVSRIEFK